MLGALLDVDEAVRKPAATAEAPVSTAGTTGAADTEDESTPTAHQNQVPASPGASTRSARRTYRVTRVVDGDTVELGNGETVRLAGIDTPEVGECGHDRATRVLERLVLGKPVSLGSSDENRDRYGRLLRYVDVGGTDAGLLLINDGLAVARYDSRDGYGYHPREPQYVAADRNSKNSTRERTEPSVRQPPATGPSCASGYLPCIPPYPPDLDCSDVDGPVHVTGPDRHRLDADDDGVACEWG
jgi:endonuclease YncB( thermonuclease family)